MLGMAADRVPLVIFVEDMAEVRESTLLELVEGGISEDLRDAEDEGAAAYLLDDGRGRDEGGT